MTTSIATQVQADSAKRPRLDRHPWLADLKWFVEASDRLMENLDPGDFLHIGINHDRDRDPTARVRVDTARTQDEIDDMPGIRRIERRAAELALHLPARPPFGAEVRVSVEDIAVNLMWRHPGKAVLLSHRRSDGWHGADMIVMPVRHVIISDSVLLARDPIILEMIDRLLGGGKIDTNTYIHSASRRGDELRVIIGAGGVLPNSGL